MWGVLSPVITRGPSSPFLLMWLFTPQAQGSSLAWIGHSDTSFPCSCWRPLPFPCGLQWGHSSFCSGLQGLLSGLGLSLGSGEEFLSQSWSVWLERPGGKSGYVTLLFIRYLLRARRCQDRALVNLRKPPTLSMEDGFH